MPNFICTTCGTQYAATDLPPSACDICDDERQYVRPTGQQWTTLDRLRLTNRNSVKYLEPNLIAIGIEPSFGIGQRALLVRSPQGNILWDCIPLLDPAIVEIIQAFGGLSAIAISHPHYYSSMIEWSRSFGDVPILLHERDREWIKRDDPAIILWTGESHRLSDDFALYCCGGHFDGGTVLHWKSGAGGQGALLSGDIVQVVADRKSVSFMRSFPNHIPLSASKIHHIERTLAPIPYERVYGAFWDAELLSDGKAIVARSVARYLKAISD